MTEITDNIGEFSAAKPAALGRGRSLRRPSSRSARRDDVAGRWAPPITWVALALVAGPYVPAWGWMWLLAFALFFACKWATWWPYRFHPRATPTHHAAFLFAYAGMDAARFYGDAPLPPPRTSDWLLAAARVTAGALLVWLVARVVLPSSAILAGWTVMIGLTMLLHFGVFDLLALTWRARGVDATPLMRRPTRAASLGDFWGNRWNAGFHALAHDLVFVPLRRTLGPAAATAAVFFASGAIHDLVISLPAGGGYGRPTLYFALQLAGLVLERTRPFRRLFARRAPLGRVFAIAIVVAPLPLLFHEKFVRNVILPFLNAIGGLS